MSKLDEDLNRYAKEVYAKHDIIAGFKLLSEAHFSHLKIRLPGFKDFGYI